MLDEEHLQRTAKLQERLIRDSTARAAALEAAAGLDPNLPSAHQVASGSDGSATPGLPGGGSTHRAGANGLAHQRSISAGAADGAGLVRLDQMVGPPRLPVTVEDVALLLWPGPSDWEPQRELPPAMASNLEQRKVISSHR